MSDLSEPREQWLRDSQDFFRSVQSYNSTIITIGYGTFFGLLLFLQGKVGNRLLFIAALLIMGSAAFFVAFELFVNIKLAIQTSRIGKEGQRDFRFWAFFFIPSVLLAVAAVALLVTLFLSNLHQPNSVKPSPNACVTNIK